MKKMIVLIITCFTIFSNFGFTKIEATSDSTQKYYYGVASNTGHDNGYSDGTDIINSDLHFGWDLGEFYVSDFTRVVTGGVENPVFLKNVGDQVKLGFNLKQDISKLNDDASLMISEDNNGYDDFFKVDKTNFGQGTLLIRHTDHQNISNDTIIYTDYLPALTVNADTEIDLLEEGDYEVALNYSIKHDPRNYFGISVFPGETDYQILFKFSIRNGNTMVYPFDVVSGAELTNSSFTENGFRLDLANSKYLNIDIEKQMIQENSNELIFDTRFNRPAEHNSEFTEEGVYTITVSNQYTEQTTVKKIYVGTNELLKAYVTTGISIEDIETQLSHGAKINQDGTISNMTSDIQPDTNNSSFNFYSPVILLTITSIFLLVIITLVIVVIKSRKRKDKK